MLANLQQEFHSMLDDRFRNQETAMEIFCFYEELPVTGISKVVTRKIDWQELKLINVIRWYRIILQSSASIRIAVYIEPVWT